MKAAKKKEEIKKTGRSVGGKLYESVDLLAKKHTAVGAATFKGPAMCNILCCFSCSVDVFTMSLLN